MGTLVGEFNASDPDTNSTLVYHFVSGIRDANHSLFTLDSNGTLFSNVTFDYEANATSYLIQVKVSDEYNASIYEDFQVNILNVVEDLDGDGIEDPYDEDDDGDGFTDEEEIAYPSDPRDPNSIPNTAPIDLHATTSLMIAENLAVGSLIGNFSATDPNGDPLTFNLVAGQGDTGNQYFSIDDNGDLRTATVFDYEKNASSFSIRIEARDPFGKVVEGNFTVILMDKDDDPEVPDDIFFRHMENMIIPMMPFTELPGGNEPTSFQLSGPDADKFQINSATGVFSFLEAPDYEAYASANGSNLYVVVITVTTGDESKEYEIDVTVSNLWEAPTNLPPFDLNFTQRLEVFENQSAGTTIGTFSANDPEDDVLKYRLSSQGSEHNNSLFILEDNGTLVSNFIFDYEDTPELVIRVEVYDDSNASEVKDFVVYVLDQDEESPVLSLNGERILVHPVGEPFIDPGANWSDNSDGNGSILSKNQVDWTRLGNMTLEYEITDSSGNSSPVVFREVQIADLEPPEIELIGEGLIVLEAGQSFIDPGAKWIDNYDGEKIIFAELDNNLTKPGIYILNYAEEDSSGNQGQTVKRVIEVRDTISPEIELIGPSKIILNIGDPFIDPGANWTDFVDVHGTVFSKDEVNSQLPGIYILDYVITDSSENNASVQRQVEIINRNPYDLEIENRLIDENTPAGIWQSKILVKDYDDLNSSDQYFFELLETSGPESSVFDIMDGGILTTTRELDFEIKNEYEIILKVIDRFGGIFEKEFLISINDLHRPLVDTNEFVQDGNPLNLVSGVVLDSGGLVENLETGFLFSETPINSYDQKGIEKVKSTLAEDLTFETTSPIGLNSTKIYYRAYAKNPEGFSLGLEESFYNSSSNESSKLFLDDLELQGDADWYQGWFGTYYKPTESRWVMHAQLGWIFTFVTKDEGIWVWGENYGWIWTQREINPYFYSHSKESWIFLYGNYEAESLFYDYTRNQWEKISNVQFRDSSR